MAVHPLVHMITGFTNILFSTLGECYKVNNISRDLQLVLHLSLMIAPEADFAICEGIIILHLASPHGSSSGSSSRVSGLSIARTRRSRRLLGLL